MPNLNVTYGDLGLIAVFAVIVIAGFYLIRVLANLGSALRGINKLINKNVENLDKIIKDLPKITENAAAITDLAADIAENVKNEQELLDDLLENVVDTVESVSDLARAFNEDLIGGVKKLAGTLSTVSSVAGLTTSSSS